MKITMKQLGVVYSKDWKDGAGRNAKIKLKDLFPDALEDGKLTLENIDFSHFGYQLCRIDFSDCVLHNCQLDALILIDCDFSNCTLDEATHTSLKEAHQCRFLEREERIQYQHAWMKRMIDRYPEEVFSYAFLLRDEYPMTLHLANINGFFEFNVSPEKKETGWKLHLSVHPQYVAYTFELLAKYFNQEKIHYKVTNIADTKPSIPNFFSSTNRLSRGTQFTLYLYDMASDKALRLIQEVTSILEKNEVPTGLCPASDQQTISSYFSLRQDRMLLPPICESLFHSSPLWSWSDTGYVSATEVGRNANPFNIENPYKNLLPASETVFNLQRHFESLPLNRTPGQDNPTIELECLQWNLKYTLLSYLREYTNIDSFDETTIEDLISENRMPLKEKYQNKCADQTFMVSLRIAAILLNEPLADLTTEKISAAYNRSEITEEFDALIQDFINKAHLTGPAERFTM